jgi:hypothetical protein
MSDMRQHVTDQVHREETAAQLALQGATARQQLRQATLLVAALVARLGGDVEVTDMDLAAIEATQLVTQRTNDGLRLGVTWPDPTSGGAGPGVTTTGGDTAVHPAGDEGVTLPPCETAGDEALGLAEVVIHEPDCPQPDAGCGHCACDVAGLAPVDVPGYPGAVTLDGDMITRPWRYR